MRYADELGEMLYSGPFYHLYANNIDVDVMKTQRTRRLLGKKGGTVTFQPFVLRLIPLNISDKYN